MDSATTAHRLAAAGLPPIPPAVATCPLCGALKPADAPLCSRCTPIATR